jgi:predicted nucleic acid-binding protein
MPSSLYLETSIISYLTGRRSRNVVITAHQQLTKKWWNMRHQQFELFVSPLVLREVTVGNPTMAQRRLRIVRELPVLALTAEATAVAEQLMKNGPLPPKAEVDALHIGVAAVHGIEYLLTWNCRHIANARTRSQIESICRNMGYEPPVMCTPEELTEE